MMMLKLRVNLFDIMSMNLGSIPSGYRKSIEGSLSMSTFLAMSMSPEAAPARSRVIRRTLTRFLITTKRYFRPSIIPTLPMNGQGLRTSWRGSWMYPRTCFSITSWRQRCLEVCRIQLFKPHAIVLFRVCETCNKKRSIRMLPMLLKKWNVNNDENTTEQ
jgi:hypothetical protein